MKIQPDQSEAKASNCRIDNDALPSSSILDYLTFVPFLLAFLGTLFFYEIRFRLCRNQTQRERTALSLNKAVVRCLWIVGTRIRIDCPDEFSSELPYLIVANHQSMFDISILHGVFAVTRPKYIAKKELGHGIPAVSICLRTEGSALIDRSNPRQAIPAIKTLAKHMEEENFSVVLFPEGTRAREGKMKEFKSAGFTNLLKESKRARIIPVAIDGSWKLAYRKRGPIPFGTVVSVRVGTEIEREGKDFTQIISASEDAVRGLLAEIREKS